MAFFKPHLGGIIVLRSLKCKPEAQYLTTSGRIESQCWNDCFKEINGFLFGASDIDNEWKNSVHKVIVRQLHSNDLFIQSIFPQSAIGTNYRREVLSFSGSRKHLSRSPPTTYIQYSFLQAANMFLGVE